MSYVVLALATHFFFPLTNVTDASPSRSLTLTTSMIAPVPGVTKLAPPRRSFSRSLAQSVLSLA